GAALRSRRSRRGGGVVTSANSVAQRAGSRLDFFLQAEDGIRDRNVTGVQTCALPIYLREFERCRRLPLPQPLQRPAASAGYGSGAARLLFRLEQCNRFDDIGEDQ